MTRTNAKPVRPTQPSMPATGTYSPSVPISLYREVATELQSNQTLMESLKTQNQELVEQNQQLRVEIERVVQSALQLRQKADSFCPVQLPGAIVPSGSEVPLGKPAPKAARFKIKSPEPVSEPEVLLTEQPATPIRRNQTVKSTEIGGWWLALVIFLIVVTAFGTGFLIVRPLLPNR